MWIKLELPIKLNTKKSRHMNLKPCFIMYILHSCSRFALKESFATTCCILSQSHLTGITDISLYSSHYNSHFSSSSTQTQRLSPFCFTPSVCEVNNNKIDAAVGGSGSCLLTHCTVSQRSIKAAFRALLSSLQRKAFSKTLFFSMTGITAVYG